jgi:uncharacterized protein (DUF927 family)
MSKFSKTKKNNPCPICGDITGHCKTTDSEMALCYYSRDAASTPEGWRFTRISKGDGIWGVIVPAGQPETGNARALRLQREAERAAVEAERWAKLKPARERHSDYSYKVANCPITEADRSDLTRRGLTGEDLSKLTPIKDGGGGYIIPIRDKDGLMVGGQRRLPIEKNKYRWATTGQNHLPETRELPLAHWQHSEAVESIALTEGTGIKPFLAARRLNALAIGAAGGNFCTSPKTLKATLDRYSDLPVVLVLDGGAVANKTVMGQYLATYNLLKDWGREPSILWWGQLTKADGDIDEISPEVATSIITWAEVLAIAIPILREKGVDTDFLAEPLPTEATGKESKKVPSDFFSSIETGLVVPGNRGRDTHVGNHLRAIANVTTPEGEGVVLEFAHRRGFKLCTMTLYRADLAGDSLATLRALARQGYDWSYHEKELLLEALHQLGREDVPDATLTNRTGWHGKTYVAAHKTYGDQSIRFREWNLQPEETPTEVAGTLNAWRCGVGARCEGNSRPTIALAVAFASPFIRLLEMAESGGIHIYGDSSEGKTTAAKVAMSITGEKIVQTWSQTINGLEGTAEAHSDSLMIMDELHQCPDPKKAGQVAYQLANEVGKVRARVTGDAKPSKTWKISYLSTGEKSLPDFLRAQGITIKAGQEVRMPSIPASPIGALYGCFETIHGADSAEAFAMDLEKASAANRGVAGDAFLSRLVQDIQTEGFLERLEARVKEIATELKRGIETNAVKRVAEKRFALYVAAIELAIDYGIVPFSKETAAKSITKVYREWLVSRDGDGSMDVKQAVSNFLRTIEQSLLSNRVYDPRNSGKTLANVLGYWMPDAHGDGKLCIPPMIFEAEFCKEVKKTSLIKELIRLGALTPRADGKFTSQQMPEPNQKTKKHYLVVNLEVSRKIGDSGDSGDSDLVKAELEALLAVRKKSDSEFPEVIQVILDHQNHAPESLESPGKNSVIQKGIFQNPLPDGIAADRITESPKSPQKQDFSPKQEIGVEKNSDRSPIDEEIVSTDEPELLDSSQLGEVIDVEDI